METKKENLEVTEAISDNVIMYIGADKSYLKDLEEKYRELSPSTDVSFIQDYGDDPSYIQSLILKIRRRKPKLVIVDFTKNAVPLLHITRAWLRDNLNSKTSFMGLCDLNQGIDMVSKAVMTTMPCVHIKSFEFESICFDINILAFPDSIESHGFATAKLDDDIKAYFPAKVTMINDDSLMVESSFQMGKRDTLRLKNYWTDQKIIDSTLVKCTGVSSENLYYNYKFSQNLEVLHAEPIVVDADTSAEDTDKQLKERDEKVENSKNKLKKWISNNLAESKPKFLKAMVVDKEGLLFKNRPQSDSYDFVFRSQPYLKDILNELTTVMPQLIVFSMEHLSEEEKSTSADIMYTFNTQDRLQELVNAVQSTYEPENFPIIIVFNTAGATSLALQKILNYQSILAIDENIDVDLLLKMCEKLREKILSSLPPVHERNIFLDKNSIYTYCEFEFDMNIKACSENDIFFDSSLDLAIGTVIRVSLPAPMYITVSEMPDYASVEARYFAYVHGIGELERQSLRRYINEVFFREKELKKQEEAEARDLQKQQYLASKEKSKQEELSDEDSEEESEEDIDEVDAKATEVLSELEEKK